MSEFIVTRPIAIVRFAVVIQRAGRFEKEVPLTTIRESEIEWDEHEERGQVIVFLDRFFSEVYFPDIDERVVLKSKPIRKIVVTVEKSGGEKSNAEAPETQEADAGEEKLGTEEPENQTGSPSQTGPTPYS